jgi:RNA polymerase sigma-70 factor (ECF subfamily)
MAQGPLAPLLRHIGRLISAPAGPPVSDGQLLDRFAGQRDGEAFAALMARHGALVWGVCRRVLGQEQEAEDAFQGTFLVLACKAGSVRRQESLAGWLCRVAYRVAVTARARTAARRARERQAIAMARAAAQPDQADLPLRLMLDEELDHLPRKYHAPLVLCYLEGKTHEAAAQELRWPLGTVKGRLARAREMLRQRLVRRGLTLSAGLAGTLVVEETALAAVPIALVPATVQAALAGAAGQSVACLVSAEVIALVEGVCKAMVVSKLKGLAVGALTLGLLLTSGGLVLHQTPAAQKSTDQGNVEDKKAKAVDRKEAGKKELERLEGTWVMVSRESKGIKQGGEDLKDWQVTIKGNEWMNTRPGGMEKATIVIDASKDPKAIDLAFQFPMGRKILTRGIYQLSRTTEGETLTLHRVDQPGLPRPKDFKASERGGIVFVFKRAHK